eukprot:937412-Pyramimonas_sp.AAC.1
MALQPRARGGLMPHIPTATIHNVSFHLDGATNGKTEGRASTTGLTTRLCPRATRRYPDG